MKIIVEYSVVVMEELEKIKELAEKIELFPELEITIEKVQQGLVSGLEDIKSKLEKVFEMREHFIMPPKVPWPRTPRVIAANVPRNSSQLITEEFVDQGHIAYIKKLALVIPDQGTTAFSVQVDGQYWKSFQITWQMGTAENPVVLTDPIEVNSNIRITAYNNSINTHCFEAFFDGYQMMRPELWYAQWGIEP